MKLQLTVRDRLMMVAFVPQTGGLVTLKVAKEILNKIEFCQKDFEFLNMFDTGAGKVEWSAEKAKQVEPYKIEFSNMEAKLIMKTLSELDQKESLSLGQYDLAVKIKEACK